MYRKLLISALALASLAAQAHQDPAAAGASAPAASTSASTSASTGTATSTATSASTAALADWAPLVAQYRVTLQAGKQTPRTETWTFWRDSRRIALIKGSEEEVWLREPSGIRLQRLYHQDHKLVDYSAGELRTMQIDARWLPLGTLIDETLLQRLRKTGGKGGLQRYIGQLQGEQIELLWDSQQRLPVQLSRRSAKGSTRFERLAVHAEAPMRWPAPSADRSDYDRIDAADFGDMEYDPFVRKVLAQDVRMGWRVAHEH
jgi:hypothetical protein